MKNITIFLITASFISGFYAFSMNNKNNNKRKLNNNLIRENKDLNELTQKKIFILKRSSENMKKLINSYAINDLNKSTKNILKSTYDKTYQDQINHILNREELRLEQRKEQLSNDIKEDEKEIESIDKDIERTKKIIALEEEIIRIEEQIQNREVKIKKLKQIENVTVNQK